MRTRTVSCGINIDGLMFGTSFWEYDQTKARSYLSASEERGVMRFGFLGNNVQGNAFAAQAMFKTAYGRGERIQVVLIHAMLDLGKAITECQQPNSDAFTLDLPEGEQVY